MSVVKGKRDTSPTEYVYQARELRKYTIQKCVGFPKRYTFYVSQPIADLSNEVYNHAIKANSIFPKKAHEARLRLPVVESLRHALRCLAYHPEHGKAVHAALRCSCIKSVNKALRQPRGAFIMPT